MKTVDFYLPDMDINDFSDYSLSTAIKREFSGISDISDLPDKINLYQNKVEGSKYLYGILEKDAITELYKEIE